MVVAKGEVVRDSVAKEVAETVEVLGWVKAVVEELAVLVVRAVGKVAAAMVV